MSCYTGRGGSEHGVGGPICNICECDYHDHENTAVHECKGKRTWYPRMLEILVPVAFIVCLLSWPFTGSAFYLLLFIEFC